MSWVEGSFWGMKFSWTTSDKCTVAATIINSFLLVFFCVFNKFVDHGGCQGNAAQSLTQWLHLVTSSEAWDVLHWAMLVCIVSYCFIAMAMAIEIDSNSPAFFRSRQFGCCRQPKVKTMVWSILNETQLDYCSYSSYESNHTQYGWSPWGKRNNKDVQSGRSIEDAQNCDKHRSFVKVGIPGLCFLASCLSNSRTEEEKNSLWSHLFIFLHFNSKESSSTLQISHWLLASNNNLLIHIFATQFQRLLI